MVKSKKNLWIVRIVVGLVLLGILYGLWSLLTSPERLRDFVKVLLHERFIGHVSVNQVEVGIFSGAKILGLQVQSYKRPHIVPLQIGAIQLSPRLFPLVEGRIVIDELVLENPVITTHRQPNGLWEMEDIFRFGDKGGRGSLRISSLIVRNGALKLQDQRAGAQEAELLRISGLNLVGLTAPGERGRLLLRGSIERSLIGPCYIFGSLDLRRNVLEVVVTRENLPLDDALAALIAPFFPETMLPFTFREGTADLKFDFVYDATPGAEIEYVSLINLRDVSALIGPKHIPLTEVNGEVEIGRDDIKCRNLGGRILGARFITKGEVARNPEREPTNLTINVTGLALDEQLKQILGPTLDKLWEELNPNGHLDITCRLHAPKGRQAQVNTVATIRLKNCSIAPRGVSQPISKLNGAVEWTGKHLSLLGVSGRYLDRPAVIKDVDVQTDGKSPMEITMEIPGVVIDEKLINAMSGEQKELMKKYQISGRLDVLCRILHQPGSSQPVQLDISAECEDLRFTYPLLKEPFERLQGRLRLVGREVVIESAEGYCGRRPVTLTDVRLDEHGLVEGTITLRDWVVDEELLSFVPQNLRSVVQDLEPSGVVDVEYKVLPLANGQQPATEMALTIRNGRVKYRAFPYEVKNIEGRMVLGENYLRVANMVACDGEATFSMPDRNFEISGKETVSIEIYGENIPLDSRLKAALSKDSQDIWDMFNPRGHINAVVRIDCIPNRDYPVVTATVDCNGSELTYKSFPYTIRDVRGTMIFTEDGVRLKGVSGKPASGTLVFGDTMLYFDQTKGMTFDIQGTDLCFDDRLRDCLPEQFRRTWQTISPKGNFNLSWHQERKPGKDQPYSYNVSLRLNGCQMKYAGLPYTLTDLYGELAYDGEKVTIQEVTGRSGEAQFTISGGVSDPTAEGVINLTIKGKNVPLDDQVRQSLPEDYTPVWQRINPSGHVSFECKITYRADEKGERFLEFDVPELQLQGCKLNLDEVSVSAIDGVVTISGERWPDHPQKNWAQGDLLLKSRPVIVTIDKLKYEFTRFTFYDEAEALHVPYFEAWCYGGKVFGAFSINKGEKIEHASFTAEFKADDVDAGRIVSAYGAELDVKGVEGKIYAASCLDGKGFHTKSLNAEGYLQIKKGNMGELPKLLGLKGSGLATIKTFTEASLKYKLANNQAEITTADLIGDPLSLHGKGKITLDGKLEMEFRPELGPGKHKIPVVGEMLGRMLGGVLPVTLTGTLKDPIWKVEPLLPLTKLLKGIASIFTGGPKPPSHK